MEAILGGHELVAQLLLNRGADAMATALSTGKQTGRESMIRFFRNPVP